MMTIEQPALQRAYFLDWLRMAAFGLLVIYHVGMYYVSWDWHVKSPFAGPGLEPWMMLSSPWRMGLLFVVSGAATSIMLQRGGVHGGFLASRSKRLLLPLLCGVLVVVPPQAYFEVVQRHGYAGGYLDFLRLYFSGYGGFCRDAKCLILPTWNHLWFLPYLWLYTLALWGLLQWRPALLETLARVSGERLVGAALLGLPIGALALCRLTLYPRFPSTHALVDDVYNHAVFLALFMGGAVFARCTPLWDEFERQRWPAIALALCGFGVLAFMASRAVPQAPAPEALKLLQRLAFATVQWSAVVAAIGFARRHLDRDHRWRRVLTEAVFPVYILHQTLIIVLAQVLLPLRWAPAIEAPVLVLATFALSGAGYAVVRRSSVLRPWFGLAGERAAAVIPARRGEASA